MSREERRQYERMTRGMDRSPALPPAARARAERVAARRAARRSTAQPHGFTARFWLVSLLVAAGVGYLAFSLQWPQPQAPIVGLAVAVVALATAIGLRLLQRRAAARR